MTQRTFTVENSTEETLEIVKDSLSLIQGIITSDNDLDIKWEFEYKKQLIKCRTLVISNYNKSKIKTIAIHTENNKVFEKFAIKELHSTIKDDSRIIIYTPKEKIIKMETTNKSSTKKWTIGFLIAVIVIPFLIFSLSNTPLEKYNCEIINTEVLNSHKKSINIRVNEKLNESQLREIARYLKQQNKEYDNLFILYYLPGMNIGSGAWATTHYNPNFNLNISSNFQSTESEKANIYKSNTNEKLNQENINQPNTYIEIDSPKDLEELGNKNTFGIWLDDTYNQKIYIRIRKEKNNKYVYELIESINSLPSNGSKPLKKSAKNGKTVFIDLDHIDLNQQFLVEKNGNLSVYDNLGFVVTYKKVNY